VKNPVFLTGATGFLGMEVLARLVEKGDRDVVALVRAADSEAATERLHGVMAKLWRDPSPYHDRVRAVAGDVTSPGLGMDRAERAEIAEEVTAVMHCAASISFDLPLPEARAINVDGTSRVLDFALAAAQARGGLERFVHVSTAYVSGRHEGAFRERQLDTGQSFRNTYEQTKADAEQIVAMARELGPAIARPSIVMGESDTGWTPAFNVLYWPMQAYSRGLFKELPALPSGRVDIVPVDYVADALVHLLDRREAGVFNLVAGRNAATVDELTTLASEYFGKPVPPFVAPVDPDSDDHDSVYVPYFDMRVVFDDARARSVLVPAGIEAPPLREYFPKLMEYAQAVRWGKQKMTREAARTRRAELAAT
jgi:thioester reductase-like protein